MLTWAFCFLAIALIAAGGVGIWGPAVSPVQIAKGLFVLFLFLFLFALIFGQRVGF